MIIQSIVAALVIQQAPVDEYSTIPTKVVVDSGGKTHVDFIELHQVEPGDFPDEIPCYNLSSDGALVSGITYTGSSPSGVHNHEYPYQLIQNQDGSWELTHASWTVYHGPIDKA